MAIDNFAERMSIIHFQQVGMPKAVIPAGSVDKADRQDFIWLYRGLLIPSPVQINGVIDDSTSMTVVLADDSISGVIPATSEIGGVIDG